MLIQEGLKGGQMQIKALIYRFNKDKDKKPYYQKYKLPYSDGMTILDLLNYIQQNLDKSLSFRWECRSGICGTCGVVVNGKPVLSCNYKIKPSKKIIKIEPLKNFPIEKDLIVDIKHSLEKLKRVRPYLEQCKKVKVTDTQANKSKPFRKCIECGCCVSKSKTAKDNPLDTLDPMAAVKLARLATDPRDCLDRKKIAKMENIDKYSKTEGKQLAASCPRNVPIDKVVKLLKK